jgi:hypothetical protein
MSVNHTSLFQKAVDVIKELIKNFFFFGTTFEDRL